MSDPTKTSGADKEPTVEHKGADREAEQARPEPEGRPPEQTPPVRKHRVKWRAKARKRGKPTPTATPTPIWISPRTRNILLLAGLGTLVLLVWAAPSVPVIALGGAALALIMSFPVRALSRIMARGWAILLSFLSLTGLIVLASILLIPTLIDQLSSLISSTPAIAEDVTGAAEGASASLSGLLEQLGGRGLLPGTPEEILADLGQDLLVRLQELAEQILGGLVGFISGAFGFGIALFGVVFVAVYLLADVRRMKAAYLMAMPHHYRRDGRDLWEAFAYSLSRYLAGLGFVLIVQGVVSAVALSILGVRYAILLGAWVSLTAIIPYIGAWLGAIPAVALALVFGSSYLPLNHYTVALITVVIFFLIQQLEGNFLTPRIQGEALQVHPILVFLAVIAGGQISGLLGILFAVPALALLRVLFDFFRVRLRTRPPQDTQPNVAPSNADDAERA